MQSTQAVAQILTKSNYPKNCAIKAAHITLMGVLHSQADNIKMSNEPVK